MCDISGKVIKKLLNDFLVPGNSQYGVQWEVTMNWAGWFLLVFICTL